MLLALALPGCVMSRTERSDRPTEVAEPARSAEQAILEALALFTGEGQRTSAAAALSGLERHADASDPTERELIATLTPVVGKVASGSAPLAAADYRSLADVMERMAARRPADFEVQYAMVRGMRAMDTALRDAGAETSATSENRARNLAARFPSQARAQAHLAQTLETSDETGAMRSYARCLRLDPSAPACKSGLKAVTERYQEPRCTKVSPAKFAVHPAFEANAATAKSGRRGLKPIKVDKRQLLMEIKPALTGQDVDEVQASGDGLTLTLSPKGTAALAAVTARLAERQGFLAILVGGKVHTAPQVMSSVETGTLRLEGVAQSRLCTKLERRPLPPDVAGVVN